MAIRAEGERMAAGQGGPGRLEWRFDSRLREVLGDIRKRFGDAVDEWGSDAVEIAKRLSPYLTGRERESIYCTTNNKGLHTTICTGSGYGAHLEFGTKNTKAYPHVIPAVRIANRNLRAKARAKWLVEG